MALEFTRTIGDGYPDYVEDELGYNYHAWEVISASESKAYEELQRADSTQLENLAQQFRPLSDLLRWALARRHLRLGQRAKYFEVTELIVDGDFDHPALHYPEILADLARRRAEDGNLDEARSRLEHIESKWPEFKEAIPLLDAQLLLLAGRHQEAHHAFDEALSPYEEDVDLRIETADDFQRAGAFDHAKTWLQRARVLALSLDDSASLVDIDLMEQSLGADEAMPTEEDPGEENPGELSDGTEA